MVCYGSSGSSWVRSLEVWRDLCFSDVDHNSNRVKSNKMAVGENCLVVFKDRVVHVSGMLAFDESNIITRNYVFETQSIYLRKIPPQPAIPPPQVPTKLCI